MRISFVVSVLAIVSGVLACSSSDPGSDSNAGATNEALKGGCRMVCPKCTPNMDVCPMIACEISCNGKPAKCVDTQLCPVGYAWDQSKCSCEPTSTCVETVMCISTD